MEGQVFLNNSTNYSIVQQKSNVGGYDITGGKDKTSSIVFLFTKKPKWYHRFFVKLFLGWKWIDENK